MHPRNQGLFGCLLCPNQRSQPNKPWVRGCKANTQQSRNQSLRSFPEGLQALVTRLNTQVLSKGLKFVPRLDPLTMRLFTTRLEFRRKVQLRYFFKDPTNYSNNVPSSWTIGTFLGIIFWYIKNYTPTLITPTGHMGTAHKNKCPHCISCRITKI